MSLYTAVRVSWENRDAPASLGDAAAIPYATLGIRIDEGREQILVLATDESGERLWTSGTAVALSTRNGRIIRTAGLGTDLTGFITGNDRREDWTRPHAYAWTADFRDLGLFSVSVVCDVRPVGIDPIVILGKQFDTLKVEETCRSEMIGWSFSNTYWVSPATGRVWRSIEHVHPKGPTIEIELLRPPLSQD
ncbi:MAG: YjbF family lipoprotein [Rhizomicrobium sp.]